jgi:hypothetical protein
LAREYENAIGVAKAIVAQAEAAGIVFVEGLIEQPAAWIEDTEAGPVLCRGVFDWVHVGRGHVLDLKTCESAHPLAIGRSCYEYGYDIQAEAYLSALRKLNPEIEGRERFTWLFAEILPPESTQQRVVITVAEPDGLMHELGRHRWQTACATWARCLESDTWPKYSNSPVPIAPPAYAITREFER